MHGRAPPQQLRLQGVVSHAAEDDRIAAVLPQMLQVGQRTTGAFDDAPQGAFSFNLLFDRAIAGGRLFGMRMDGQWLHVGTPEAIHEAETAIAESAA